jgi:16S rRNA (cytosine967-C5)-methyltransferase
MKSNPRQFAVEILNRVDEGAYAEPLLDHYLSENAFANIQDRKLLTQLVYGTLRMRGRLDWIIGILYRGRMEKMDPGIRNILRTGLYQLTFMDRIPDHAVVDQGVRLASKWFPGRSGLVNAVLRNAIRRADAIPYPEWEKNPAEFIATFHSHPLWLVKRWIELFGPDEALALCRFDNETPELCVRVNRLKIGREALLERLAREGYKARETEFSPEGVRIMDSPGPVRENSLLKEGYARIQDEGSQLVSHVVAPRPGSQVLDLCSGSGGKTTHLAELMENSGRVLAVDIHPGKLESLQVVARCLGIGIVATVAGDASGDLGGDCRERFDCILVDAPCSGLGTLRRNPEIKWRVTPDNLKEFQELQKKILDRSGSYLKKGGILVYSTCTVLPEENETPVGEFLSRHRDFKLLGTPQGMSAELADSSGFFRTYPHRHGMDGFFAARMQKSARP